MSVFSALRNLNNTGSIEEALRAKDCTSPVMRQAIREWIDLYLQDDAPVDENDCQRLPVLIVSKLTKTIFSEYEAEYEGGGEDADRLLRRLAAIRDQAMQWALVGGECFVKPILTDDGLDFVLVRRDCFVPFGRDAKGRVTDLGMLQTDLIDGAYYTLLERRTLIEGGRLQIENRLYRSHEVTMLGSQLPLAALPQYEGLAPVTVLPEPMGNLGMAMLRTPQLNTVDGSADAVSVYAPAVGLIHEINRNEKQLSEEFANGASRIIASSDLIETDNSGRRKLGANLFVAIDDSPENVGVTIFSPTLREQSYLTRKQEYLRNVESLIGFKRGILSEVEAAERTATEITSSQGDYNLTIMDFQRAWEAMLRELLPICAALERMYRLGGGQYDPEKLSVNWGDGVLYNRDRAWQELRDMVADGMLKPELALAWYFDLPKDTPEDLAKIRETYMPPGEELT